jgi:hypothetical protein
MTTKQIVGKRIVVTWSSIKPNLTFPDVLLKTCRIVMALPPSEPSTSIIKAIGGIGRQARGSAPLLGLSGHLRAGLPCHALEALDVFLRPWARTSLHCRALHFEDPYD